MKTITYNPQREIITALLVLFISFTLMTALRAQPYPENRAWRENKTVPIAENALISVDKVMTETRSIENYLTLKIGSWINSGSYWNSGIDEETTDNKLAYKIKKWMSDGSFWSPKINRETDIDELALSKKEQLNSDVLTAGRN